MKMEADVVIVGTGAAGRFSVLNLPGDKKIIMITKSDLESRESLEQLRALYNGYKIAVDIFEEEIPPGVDTLSDLEAVRAYLQKK